MLITQHIPLVLASGSAIRAQMLKAAGLNFSVVPSAVDEDIIKQAFMAEGRPNKGDLARELAKAKALAVSSQYPDHLTIGADQLCVGADGTIYDKPGTSERAREQLSRLSGETHTQHSGICVAKGEQIIWETVEKAQLSVRALSEAEIAAYIDTDQPLSSCGSYRFEGMGRHLFSRIEGDHDVIKGLPLVSLLFTLYQQGAVSLG
jgi:septum formation protein